MWSKSVGSSRSLHSRDRTRPLARQGHNSCQTRQRLQASCQSAAGHRQKSFRQLQTRKRGQLNMCDTLFASGRYLRPVMGGYRHEVLVELCRTLSYGHPANYITVRPERYGSVVDRKRRRYPARHHGRSAEARGEAAACGKATAEADARGNNCISPGSVKLSNVTASARFSTSEDCCA